MSEQPAIELAGVGRVFRGPGGTVHALRDINLRLAPGSFVALMGPSGSGKTTLINLVGGLDRPTSGRILLHGRDLTRLSEGDLAGIRRRIGFIFQSFALMPTATAYENIELGLRIAAAADRRGWRDRILGCLAAVGMEPWADHRPYELSGGQQQRVAIARALALRPQLILADEPTGDLDAETGARVLQLMRMLAERERVTLLVSTHDPETAAYASQVIRLQDGEILGA